MATKKAIESNPINNNGGVVNSEGNLSTLSSITKTTQVFDNTIVGTYGGSLTFEGSQYFRQLKIGNPNNTAYNSLDKFTTSYPSDISYTTGQPEAVISNSGTYWLNTNRKFNNLSGFTFLIGQKTTFNDRGVISTIAPYLLGLTFSTLVGTQQKISKSLSTGFALYSGPVSHNNPNFLQTYYVEFLNNGTITNSGTYNLQPWSKMNFNLQNVNSVNIYQTTESGIPFAVGLKNNSTASTVSRTVSVSTSQKNPYTFNDSANITLVDSEKGVRVSTSGVGQFMFIDIDENGVKSPVSYNILPSGMKLTYYPSYANVALGEVQGKTLTVEVLS